MTQRIVAQAELVLPCRAAARVHLGTGQRCGGRLWLPRSGTSATQMSAGTMVRCPSSPSRSMQIGRPMIEVRSRGPRSYEHFRLIDSEARSWINHNLSNRSRGERGTL
jgi:hypothetical protein